MLAQDIFVNFVTSAGRSSRPRSTCFWGLYILKRSFSVVAYDSVALRVWLGLVTKRLGPGAGGKIMFCFKISGFVCVTNTAGNSHNGLFKTCAFGATETATHVPGLLKGLGWLQWAQTAASCLAAGPPR